MTLCWVLFMLLTVSAGELLSNKPAFATAVAETINGILGQTVLLPCNCSGINLDCNFVWQMEEPDKKGMFKYNKSNPSGFVPEDNCSLTLSNITAKDQGIYTCRFNAETYKQYSVMLNVSEPASFKKGDNFTGKPDSASSKKGQNFAGKKELWVPLLITILLALGLALFLYYQMRISKLAQKRTIVTTVTTCTNVPPDGAFSSELHQETAYLVS